MKCFSFSVTVLCGGVTSKYNVTSSDILDAFNFTTDNDEIVHISPYH